MTLEEIPLWIEQGDTAVITTNDPLNDRIVRKLGRICPFAFMRRAVYRRTFLKDLTRALRSDPNPSLDQ